jgi:hypothetical protein
LFPDVELFVPAVFDRRWSISDCHRLASSVPARSKLRFAVASLRHFGLRFRWRRRDRFLTRFIHGNFSFSRLPCRFTNSRDVYI